MDQRLAGAPANQGYLKPRPFPGKEVCRVGGDFSRPQLAGTKDQQSVFLGGGLPDESLSGNFFDVVDISHAVPPGGHGIGDSGSCPQKDQADRQEQRQTGKENLFHRLLHPCFS